ACGVARKGGRGPLGRGGGVGLGGAGSAAGASAIVVGIVGLIAAGITPSKVWHKFNEPAASPTAVSGPSHLGSIASTSRWNWWQEAWKAWKAHPALGTGAGAFELTHRKLRVAGTGATEPHNLPLQFLSETGVIGFILFLGIALAGAGALVETLRRLTGEDRLAAAALAVALFAYVVH